MTKRLRCFLALLAFFSFAPIAPAALISLGDVTVAAEGHVGHPTLVSLEHVRQVPVSDVPGIPDAHTYAGTLAVPASNRS